MIYKWNCRILEIEDNLRHLSRFPSQTSLNFQSRECVTRASWEFISFRIWNGNERGMHYLWIHFWRAQQILFLASFIHYWINNEICCLLFGSRSYNSTFIICNSFVFFHQEVASDSFCLLINSSWLIVFILYVFSFFFFGFNIYCWTGIHFS